MTALTQKRRVLIIEDNLSDQSLFVAWFERMPGWYRTQGLPEVLWTTTLVSTLNTALQAIQQAHDTQQFFWLVVLDLSLPDAQGFDGWIRLTQFGKELEDPKYCPPVLIVTGSMEKTDLEQLHRHVYLLKSEMTPDTFYQAVERVIADHATA